MTVRFRLVAIILFVALVPLAVSALTALRVHERALDARTGELHRKTVEMGAAATRGSLDAALRSLRLLVQGTIRWGDLSPAERDGALWVAYRQLDEVVAVALLDERGRGLGPSVYLDEQSPKTELADHSRATPALLEAFAARIPFDAARAAGVAVGKPFAGTLATGPVLPVAIAVSGPNPATRWVVAVALSLRTVCGQLTTGAVGDVEFSLLDDAGAVVCGRAGVPPGAATAPTAAAAEARMLRYRAADGRDLLAALAPAGPAWTVVSQQPARSAFAASRRIRLQALFWLAASLVATLAAGLFLARSISRPIAQLVDGTRKFAAGDFTYRLPAEGKDEFARLSRAFNDMGVEIDRRDAEIRRWNEELQARVDQRTQELKEAQDQLLHSRKIAAMSSLGAGIAHEINNPLTSVLGLAQVLILRAGRTPGTAEYVQHLTAIESEAQRIRAIVETLRSLAESYGGEGFTRLDLSALVDDSLRLVEARCAGAAVRVERTTAEHVPPVLGNRLQLQQVLLQLFDNSLKAMPDGGRLHVGLLHADGVVRLTVTDSGIGIAPENLDNIFDPFFTTKSDWKGRGLGLTTAYRVIEQHHGSIKAASQVGQGTTMTITLPPVLKGTHLV